ncbi:hypothetical protein ACXR0O_26495 [Verrucomicrobiota bacterium sgz303538]
MRILPACALFALLISVPLKAAEKQKPILRDFLGLCVHTVQFKPELYAPITRLVRDYHPLKWDLGDDTSFATTFPLARNRVDWSNVYGGWKAAGYRTSVSLMFDDVESKKWRDIPQDAFAYGKAFASVFGPSGQGLVEAAEIGNEPGKYDDATYRTLLESMARGIREGDSKMQIATCAVNLGPSGRYSKSVDTLKGLESLYDVLNVHIYPEVEGWPTWRRSYPEDPTIGFRRDLGHVLQWRKESAPSKEVWLTEFGYDASTKPAPTTGTFAKWIGNTEEQQAMWTVRGFLVLAASGVDRAYLYFFNDNDEAHVHGSSGLTRNFVPKPAFHAVAHLQNTLGDFRLNQVIRESAEEGYAYEWVHGTDSSRRITVVWTPTGPERSIWVPVDASKITRVEKMPLTPGAAEQVEIQTGDGEKTTLLAGERPVYVY